MLLKVPIDIVPPDELHDILFRLMPREKKPWQKEKSMDIVLLSLWDLLRARRSRKYMEYVFNAALVIPISKSLVSGAKFLTGKTVYRYMPFKFVISILTFLEKHDFSVYFFGGTSKVLKKAEKNIHMTFPTLKVVGRCEGTIRKKEEGAVIEAIRKASPSLLLLGKGRREAELWIHKNSNLLNRAFRLWCSDLFDVFAEKKQRPSDAVFDKGLEHLLFCFKNPFKFFRLLPYFWYLFLLLINRLFNKSCHKENRSIQDETLEG